MTLAAVLEPADGQLALGIELDPPFDPPLRPNLRVVTGADHRVERMAARFAQAVVDVLSGARGVQQLLRWTTMEVYVDLCTRVTALTRQVPATGERLRTSIRSVHVTRPLPETAEVSIHVRHGHRSRAIAARFEVVDDRWRCSVLDFG